MNYNNEKDSVSLLPIVVVVVYCTLSRFSVSLPIRLADKVI